MKSNRGLILAGLAALVIAAVASVSTWLAVRDGGGGGRVAAIGATGDETSATAGTVQTCADERGALRLVDPAESCLVGEARLTLLGLEKAGAYTLWVSPLYAQSNPAAACNALHGGGGNSGLLQILANATCNNRSMEVEFPLALPGGWKIERVTVCYRTSSTRTFIRTLQLVGGVTQPGTPGAGHYDPTDLGSTTATCADSVPSSPVPIDGAMMLSLDIWVGTAPDHLEIGGLGFKLVPF